MMGQAQVPQHSLNDWILEEEEEQPEPGLLVFKHISWGLIDSLKLRAKTPAHKVPTPSTGEDQSPTDERHHSENLPICFFEVMLLLQAEEKKNPGLHQICIFKKLNL